jgi:hypothetical protein
MTSTFDDSDADQEMTSTFEDSMQVISLRRHRAPMGCVSVVALWDCRPAILPLSLNPGFQSYCYIPSCLFLLIHTFEFGLK